MIRCLTMRIYFFLLFLPFASFSQDSDSTSYDTSYRLSDFQSHFYQLNGLDSKFIKGDTSLQFIVIETEPPKRIHRAPSGGNYPIGSNYDSTHNVDPKVATLIAVCFLFFILYIIFRVWRSLKSDKQNKRQ